MSFQRNVFTGVYIPKSTDPISATTNGFECPCTSCACGRGAARSGRIQMGQKVTSQLFLRAKQDSAKYGLFMLMYKLLDGRL